MQWVWLFLNAHLNEVFSKGLIHLVRTQDFLGGSINFPRYIDVRLHASEIKNVAFQEELIRNYKDECY